MYCYRKVLLHFLNVDSIEWHDKKFKGSTDASGELDYGNIDSFIGCKEVYELIGDWGRVVVRGQSIEIVVED